MKLVSNNNCFGFNGMLRDDDVKEKYSTIDRTEGTGNSYDFGARIYDPRVGRFLSLDPMMKKYPGQNPYLFSWNNPIIYKDVDGKWGITVHHYMIENVFKGNPELIKIMTKASDLVDSKPYNKMPNYHAMMKEGQTYDQYVEAVNNIIENKVNSFIETGNLNDLGMALHVIADRTCPSHVGQIWTPIDNPLLYIQEFNDLTNKLTGDKQNPVPAYPFLKNILSAINIVDHTYWDFDMYLPGKNGCSESRNGKHE